MHPNWSEGRVEKEESTFFRRDPFNDIVGFRFPSKDQPFLQLGERKFVSIPIQKRGLVSKFRFPLSITNKGFRIQSRKKIQRKPTLNIFARVRENNKIKMRFL